MSYRILLSVPLLAVPALGQQIPDRATFDSIAPNAVLNDFETYVVAAGTQELLQTSQLDADTSTGGQGPGLVEPGVEFNDLTSSPLAWNGDGYGGVPSRTLTVSNSGEVWIDLVPFPRAVGFDIMSEQGQPFVGTVLFFTCPGGSAGQVDVSLSAGGTEKVFVGWQSSSPICQIEIFPTSPTSGKPFLEDFAYGDYPLFTSFCTSTANSTGGAAVLSATGSPSLAANDITLRAEPLPAGNWGGFVYGPSTFFAPFGNGFRCVGDPLSFVSPLQQPIAGGFVEQVLDLPALGLAPGAAHFQYWFRDCQAGAPKLDASDGITITFVP